MWIQPERKKKKSKNKTNYYIKRYIQKQKIVYFYEQKDYIISDDRFRISLVNKIK